MKVNKIRKSLGHTVWFKVLLTIFVFLPSISQFKYDPTKSSNVIASVLSHPLSSSIPVLLPIAKLLLLFVVILSITSYKFSKRLLLGYYGFILIVVGIFQNMAFTKDYGFVWLLGNTLVQFLVAFYCFYDVIKNKTAIKKENVNERRLWVIVPMLLAFLMPYSVDTNNIVRSSFTISALINEAGVTYCMITPVIIGILVIFSEQVYKPVLSVISYVGLIFGLLNMMTWFGMQSVNWWMGILHFPLLILSFYGLIIVKREKNVSH